MMYVSCMYVSQVNFTPEEFENGGFSLKAYQMEKFKNATINSHLNLCLKNKKTRAGISQDYREVIVFEKLRF